MGGAEVENVDEASEVSSASSDVLVSRRVVLWGPIVTGLAVAALGSGTSVWMNNQSIRSQVDAENQTYAREAYLDFYDKGSSFVFHWRYPGLGTSIPSPKVDELISSFSKVTIYGNLEARDRASDVLDKVHKAIAAGALTDSGTVSDWNPTDEALTSYQLAVRDALSISSV